jgi:hypothetical protein
MRSLPARMPESRYPGHSFRPTVVPSSVVRGKYDEVLARHREQQPSEIAIDVSWMDMHCIPPGGTERVAVSQIIVRAGEGETRFSNRHTTWNMILVTGPSFDRPRRMVSFPYDSWMMSDDLRFAVIFLASCSYELVQDLDALNPGDAFRFIWSWGTPPRSNVDDLINWFHAGQEILVNSLDLAAACGILGIPSPRFRYCELSHTGAMVAEWGISDPILGRLERVEWRAGETRLAYVDRSGQITWRKYDMDASSLPTAHNAICRLFDKFQSNNTTIKTLNIANRADPLGELRERIRESGVTLGFILSQCGTWSINDLAQWETLLAHIPEMASNGFGVTITHTDWAKSLLGWLARPELGNMASNFVRYVNGYARIEVNTANLAKFFKEEMTDHPFVESVTSISAAVLRVVLREFVRPVTVVRRGRTYIEDIPGTLHHELGIHAFDLKFAKNNTSFPSAQAYSDKKCTISAKHTNISSSGAVCLGDINRTMSDMEVQSRGGFRHATLEEFIQMLRQCNLDSAYNSERGFVLEHPGMISDDDWRDFGKQNPEVTVPGLRELGAITAASFAELDRRMNENA